MIHCVCESCQTAVEVSDNYAGSRIACKSCKAIMRVPQASSTNGSSPAASSPAAAAAPKPAPPKPAAPQPQAKAPAQPPAKAPAAQAKPPQPQAKAPAAPQPAAKVPAPQSAPAAQKPAAPQAPAKPPQPQPKQPAPAPQPQAKAPPPKPAPVPAKPAPAPEPVAMLVMVEAVQFNCSQCANVLQAWPEQVGMAMNCPYCQVGLTVPTPAPPQIQARPAPVKSGGSHPNVVKPAGTHPNVVKSSGSHPKPPAKGAAPAKKGFRFPCEKCKSMIQADNSQIGLMIVCPQCKHDMSVPEPA